VRLNRPLGNRPYRRLVRPFITDDARIVGRWHGQLETWGRLDPEGYQHWALFALGPTKWLELTAGGLAGLAMEGYRVKSFSYALPLIQAKFLFREYVPNKPPGVGLVVGSFFPYGSGAFVAPSYGLFSFATITQCFGKKENVLLHGNVGFNYLYRAEPANVLLTWGGGTQVLIYKGFHLVGEVFSGDPYIPGAGESYQVGFRHFISDAIQLDGTVGQGFGGKKPLPLWFSLGLHAVKFDLLKRKNPKPKPTPPVPVMG